MITVSNTKNVIFIDINGNSIAMTVADALQLAYDIKESANKAIIAREEYDASS